jgi:hypothetical protein
MSRDHGRLTGYDESKHYDTDDDDDDDDGWQPLEEGTFRSFPPVRATNPVVYGSTLPPDVSPTAAFFSRFTARQRAQDMDVDVDVDVEAQLGIDVGVGVEGRHVLPQWS